MGKTTRPNNSKTSALRTIVDDLSNFDVAELADFDRIAEWPQPIRQFVLLIVLLLGLSTGYFYFLSEPQMDIGNAQNREAQLRGEFSLKAIGGVSTRCHEGTNHRA